MYKILFFIVIIVIIYFAWRSTRAKQIELEKRLDRQEKKNTKSSGGGHYPSPQSEDLVKCARCGSYVPKSEAFSDGKDYFCSREHRHAGAK